MGHPLDAQRVCKSLSSQLISAGTSRGLGGCMRLTLIALIAVAPVALAAQPKRLNMPVGHTTTVSMSAPVSKVTVENPSLVEVTRRGRQVIFVGRSTGSTEVTVQTADGETHLRIYVAADKYGLPQ
ncbi:MAG: pilus assembly protein N-terminal domain-containing protein [Archangium sp.]|nr:pilus assembly protein N-terminal domain-containing protein [Archangium sp.]MDP3158054.1 pilus assembly protein N-terminal domain-containing protein [Archangium sp.]MDP3570540.1 pilus assembly protein N-terminal domain-containing protein [Archangium sp.]